MRFIGVVTQFYVSVATNCGWWLRWKEDKRTQIFDRKPRGNDTTRKTGPAGRI